MIAARFFRPFGTTTAPCSATQCSSIQKSAAPHSLQKPVTTGDVTSLGMQPRTTRNTRIEVRAPPEPTHRTLSLWPLCLSGKNNHGDTENTEKPRTFGAPQNRTSGSGDSPNIRSPRLAPGIASLYGHPLVRGAHASGANKNIFNLSDFVRCE